MENNQKKTNGRAYFSLKRPLLYNMQALYMVRGRSAELMACMHIVAPTPTLAKMPNGGHGSKNKG